MHEKPGCLQAKGTMDAKAGHGFGRLPDHPRCLPPALAIGVEDNETIYRTHSVLLGTPARVGLMAREPADDLGPRYDRALLDYLRERFRRVLDIGPFLLYFFLLCIRCIA